MKNPKCKSCGRPVFGKQHRWANIHPLCRNCYSFRCRTTIKTSNLVRKLQRGQQKQQTKARGFLEWLFG